MQGLHLENLFITKPGSNLKRLITILIISLISVGLNLSCNGKKQNSDKRITITFWHSFVFSTTPALNRLIAQFEKENPDIHIVPQYIPTGDALIQKLITSVQSKTAPDISWLHSDFLEPLVEAGAIYKMDDFIKGKNGIAKEDIDDIYPSMIQYASWRGTMYTIPMEATNLALLYNKEMFKKAGLDPNKPPKTWQELYDYSKKLTFDKDGDGRYDQVGFFLPIYPAAGPLGAWMVWQWMPFLWQAGGDLINQNQTQVLYNSNAGVEALQLWKNIYNDLKLSSFTSDFDVAFKSKHLAMAMDGPWNLPRYKDFLKGIDWAFAPLPAGPQKQATIVGGEYLAIFKQSKNPDAAWRFIKWIIRPDIQAKWAMESGYLPVRHAVLNVPEFKDYLTKNPNFKVFVDQMEYGLAQKPIDYGGLEISRQVAEAIEKATVGNMDPKKSLDESAVKSNKLLNSVAKK